MTQRKIQEIEITNIKDKAPQGSAPGSVATPSGNPSEDDGTRKERTN